MTGGPCVQIATDPILTIATAVDATSGAAITQLTLTDIKVNGTPVLLEFMQHLSSTAKVVGAHVECGIPCGFGESEGTYTATVTADGYNPLSLSVAARYSSSVGGCPNIVSGSTLTSVVLQSL